MKIRIFQSDHGDCILISTRKSNILIDGGTASSYSHHVAPVLARMRNNGVVLDLVCVSHIDQDHISGILQMLEEEVDWRVYDFHKNNGSKCKKPKSLRPAGIREIWHNAFYEYASRNKGNIEKTLAADATILGASHDSDLKAAGGLAHSIKEAIQLSGRLRSDQLDIPLNKRFKGKLVMYRQGEKPFSIGDLKFTLIAPFATDLKNLRTEWNKWLSESTSQKTLKALKEKLLDDEMFLTSSDGLRQLLEMAKKLGEREKVTFPNLASIMFLVEEGSKSLLMTGDGAGQDIIKGLTGIGRLDERVGLHVDVLKVQHHGSEKNIDENFCRLITADHYIFCGNGHSDNPEIAALDAIIRSRTTPGDFYAITPEAGNNFTFWFNSSETLSEKYSEHMARIEQYMRTESGKYPQLRCKFMPGNKSYVDLRI